MMIMIMMVMMMMMMMIMIVMMIMIMMVMVMIDLIAIIVDDVMKDQKRNNQQYHTLVYESYTFLFQESSAKRRTVSPNPT